MPDLTGDGGSTCWTTDDRDRGEGLCTDPALRVAGGRLGLTRCVKSHEYWDAALGEANKRSRIMWTWAMGEAIIRSVKHHHEDDMTWKPSDAECNQRVLVCGGRNLSDSAWVFSVLDDLAPRSVIHGAARGADSLAAAWANARGVPCRAFPAAWGEHGRAAGPIRNRQMLHEGKPTLVVAFPGGRGTANMMKQAIGAGVPVLSLDP